MMNFATKILTSPIAGGSVGVFALGQAGFVIKTDEGKLIALDPYLSNCCERYFGFKRLMPYVLDPLDIEFDLLIASHAHYDHFDPDSVPALMGNKKTHFIGALDTRAECDRLGIPMDIQVDGGIAADTAPLVKKAGANVLVAGSSVFASPDPQKAIENIRNLM